MTEVIVSHIECHITMTCDCGFEFTKTVIEDTHNLPDGEPIYDLESIPTALISQLVGELVYCPDCDKSYVMTVSSENDDETTRMYLERT